MEKKRLGNDLTQGSILKRLIIFILPLLAANIIQQLYNTVDMIIIGQFVGSSGTVAVSVGGQAAQFFTIVSMSFSTGGQVYISQLFGAKEHKGVNEAVGTLFTTVFLLSLLMMLLGFCLTGSMLDLLNTPEEALAESRIYMIITFFGFPFIFGYNAICAALRGMGESKSPLYFIIVAACSNIVLDITLVLMLDSAAAATAIATVAAQAISFIYAFTFLFRRRDRFDFDFKLSSFKLKLNRLKIITRLGLPLMVQSICIQATLMVVNSLINAYGLVASATNSIGNKVTQLANTVSQSINTGGSTMIGQNLGAGNKQRAKKVVYTALALALCIAFVTSVLALTVPRGIYRMFTNDPEVIEFGVTFMKVSVITFILAAIMGPFQSMVTGSGFASLGLAVGILDGVVFRLGFAWIFANFTDLGVTGYFLATAIARLGPCLICGWYFFSGKWQNRRSLVEEKK